MCFWYGKYLSLESEKIRQGYRDSYEIYTKEFKVYLENFDAWKNHLWFCKRCGNLTNTKEMNLLGNGES